MPQLSPDNFPRIAPGQRVVLAGRSGSGKSTLGCWLLKRSPLHWIILNPKHTKAYNKLPDAKVIDGIDFKKIEKSLQENKFTVVNPTIAQNSPDNLDNFVLYLHETYEKIGLCCDELYTMHKNGQAGSGLIAWLTRGRELKQSFLGQTQRPAWISQFVFSESTFIGGMALNLSGDRKRMYDMTGQPIMLEKMAPHDWCWYSTEKDTLRSFAPVPYR